MNNCTEIEVLLKAVELGNIDLASVLEANTMKERERILEEHQKSYEIWQADSETDKRWKTYIPDYAKGRKLKAFKEKESLENFLVKFYKERNALINFTVEDGFNKWISNKTKLREASEIRYRSDFERFFLCNDNNIKSDVVKMFGKRVLKHVTEDILIAFLKGCVEEFDITEKAYGNLKTIVNGIFSERGLNIDLRYVKNTVKSNVINFKVIEKPKQEQVFFVEEMAKIIEYLDTHPTIKNLGLKFTFKSGVRTGELSALTKEDFFERTLENGKVIHYVTIRKTETRIIDKKTGKQKLIVVNIPKTDAGYRDIILNDEGWETFQRILKLNPNGEYLFVGQNNNRIKGKRFNEEVHKMCTELGIPVRTMHKIRRTYCTQLLDNNTDQSIVTEQMGHRDISTTLRCYYKGNKGDELKAEQIAVGLSSY